MAAERQFITIKKVNSFFGYPYQCDYCDKLCQSVKLHRCTQICSHCRQIGQCPPVYEMTFCELCRRSFRGDDCYRKHIENGIGAVKNSKKLNECDVKKEEECVLVDGMVCEQSRICEHCFHFIDARRKDTIPQVCSDKWCSVCNKHVDENHQCYIQKYTKNPPEKWVLVFYDFETSCEKRYRNADTCSKHLTCINQIYV